MNKTILSALALILILSSMALAAPKFTIQTNSQGGLTIIYPETQVFKYGSNVRLYFHVYNASQMVNGTTTNCSIDIYNKTNNVQIVDTPLSASGHDFSYLLNMSNLHTGLYGYLVTCSKTSGLPEVGFVAGSFYLSTDGEDEQNNAWVIPALLIFLPLLFGWMLLQWCVSLGDDHAEIKIFLSILSLMTVFISMWWGMVSIIKFFEWTQMQDAIGFVTWILALVFVVIWAYFIIYFIRMALKAAKEARIERLKY